MSLIQITAGQGPDECQLAVAKTLYRLSQEAAQLKLTLDLVEEEAGNKLGTLRSVLLSLEGDGAERLIQQWEGTIQWTCVSPYRPKHLRKNWFVGVFRCVAPEPDAVNEIRFETTRSSGPGGQHVNKTESAVRATHIASGITVKVQTERSQHANKRLAELLIAHLLACRAEEAQGKLRAERRLQHDQLERGNPTRVFKGEKFAEVMR
jgi:peptide chain release factor